MVRCSTVSSFEILLPEGVQAEVVVANLNRPSVLIHSSTGELCAVASSQFRHCKLAANSSQGSMSLFRRYKGLRRTPMSVSDGPCVRLRR